MKKIVILLLLFVLSIFAQSKLQPITFSLESHTNTIHVSLEKSEHVTIQVYDILGRKMGTLVDERVNPGEHKFKIDKKILDLPSGIYIIVLQSSKLVIAKKLSLVK